MAEAGATVRDAVDCHARETPRPRGRASVSGAPAPPRRLAGGTRAAHPRSSAERRLCAARQRHRPETRQYGPYRIVRPGGPGDLAKGLAGDRTGSSADAVFTGDTDEEGIGRWRFPKTPLGETWPMNHDGIDYLGRFTSFRHVGVFPEQASHWDHMAGADRGGGAAGQGAQPVRLYRRCLAGGGARRRRGHPCRRLEEGDRLGARKPGAGRARRQADPLDLSTTR